MRACFPVTSLGLILSLPTYAGHSDIEELLVTGSQPGHIVEVTNSFNLTPDTAALLKKVPGANTNGNGPLTGIQQYRGMYGSRVNVQVNGANIASGGPNWMDPPLSYAPAAQLDTLKVYRGIAPVSAGQETIGGAMKADLWAGDFGETGEFDTSGRVRVGGQSVNDSWLTSAAVVASNKNHRIKLATLVEEGDDAEFDGGEVLPSEYERERFDLGYGFQSGAHTLQIDVTRNETGDTGTPALPMDIEYIDTDLASLKYSYAGHHMSVTGQLYYSDIEHGMSNFHLRAPGMLQRRNVAEGDNLGFKLIADWKDNSGKWTLGVDSHNESHDSNISDPGNSNFAVGNFNNAEREVYGIFIERNQKLSNKWLGEFGLRYNRVKMDADEVSTGMMPGGNPNVASLRDNFNTADRSQNDDNFDAVAKFYYQASPVMTYYLGFARKTRSPSYQERYLWLPLQATAGLADGFTYTGNINLDPEVAHEIEVGFDHHVGAFSIAPRIFYKEVDDYIQGTASSNMAARMFVNMMMPMAPSPLEFNNVDAEFYGFDIEAEYQIDNHWSLGALVNYVRGKRKNVSDNLYRIAPLNGLLTLTYQGQNWSTTLESVWATEQDDVSQENAEQETSGYGLLNLKGDWQFNKHLRLALGIDNLLDKRYSDHLGGINRVMNPDLAVGERLPGYGRNAFVRVDYQW